MLQFAPTLARILLRYAAGALVTYGVLEADTAGQIITDPDIALMLGAAISAGTEAAYAWVRARGGNT